jgi:hypothetical protein
LNAQETKKVCFIGNSYTASNDLPGIIADLAEADGNALESTAMTPGGATFELHSTLSYTLDAIAAEEWDFVVLQEQSQRPSFPWVQVTEEVIPFADFLIDSIRSANACAIPVFFNTWGRRDGEPMWDSINTFTKMNQRLHNAYDYMADEFSTKLSPVGIGFEHIYNDDESPVPFIDLYTGDGSHPSIFGSYLAACVFYEVLFDESVEGNTFISGGIDPEQGAYLQSVAHHVVHEVDSVVISYTQPIASFEMELDGLTATFTNLSEHAFTYLWDFGDGTSTEEHPVHTFSTFGTYLVTLNAAYCEQNDNYMQDIDILSLKSQDKSTFQIYPNPANDGTLKIDCEGLTKEVQILSLEGKLVRTVHVNGTETIHLDPGIYLLVVDEQFYEKIIVR